MKSDLCVRKEARWSSSFRFIPVQDIPHHPYVPVSCFLHLSYADLLSQSWCLKSWWLVLLVVSFVGHFVE